MIEMLTLSLRLAERRKTIYGSYAWSLALVSATFI